MDKFYDKERQIDMIIIIKKEFSKNKNRSVKWLIAHKPKENDRKIAWIDLETYQNAIELDNVRTKQNGIEGTVKMLELNEKRKRRNILNDPCAMLNNIERIRMQSIFKMFFKQNAKYDFNSQINNDFINDFNNFANPKQKEYEDEIKREFPF